MNMLIVLLIGLGFCLAVLQVEMFCMYLWYLELKEVKGYNPSQIQPISLLQESHVKST